MSPTRWPGPHVSIFAYFSNDFTSCVHSLIREADGFARIRLATTAIAVERFRLACGRLPENLNELVPQFLSAVPADPFSVSRCVIIISQKDTDLQRRSDDHDDGDAKSPPTGNPATKALTISLLPSSVESFNCNHFRIK